MGKEDVKNVHDAVPPAVTLIASHMDAINHCVLTRAELREFADRNGLSHRLLIPEDGEDYTY